MHTASVYEFLDSRAKAYDSSHHAQNLNILVTEVLEKGAEIRRQLHPSGSSKVMLVYPDGSEVLFTHEEGFHASYVPQGPRPPDEVAPTPAPRKKAAK
jgi:hypothetical protein